MKKRSQRLTALAFAGCVAKLVVTIQSGLPRDPNSALLHAGQQSLLKQMVSPALVFADVFGDGLAPAKKVATKITLRVRHNQALPRRLRCRWQLLGAPVAAIRATLLAGAISNTVSVLA